MQKVAEFMDGGPVLVELGFGTAWVDVQVQRVALAARRLAVENGPGMQGTRRSERQC
jgi:hypothetical protein